MTVSRKTLATKVILVTVLVSHARHSRVVGIDHAAVHIIAVGETSHTEPPTRTSTSALGMSGERVASGKFAITFGANMWLFPGVKLAMALQIMQTSKAHLAFGTNIWLFLTVREQMALQVVMSRKFGMAVRASMFLGARSRRTLRRRWNRIRHPSRVLIQMSCGKGAGV